MKIGLDVFNTNHARGATGSYILHFTSTLLHLIKKNTFNFPISLSIFGSEEDKWTYTSGKDLEYISVPLDTPMQTSLWHLTRIENFLENNGFSAVLYPSILKAFPLSFKCPGVAIINSVLSKKLENEASIIKKVQLKHALSTVQRVVACSDYIKNDLITLGIDKDNIETIYNGVDETLFYPSPTVTEEVLDIKPFSIRRPYFVYATGLTDASKHHIELINAFNLFKERTHLPHRLVLAGKEGDYAREVRKEVLSSPFASDIFIIGFFPYKDFSILYRAASLCLFPSICEGVASPVLEAMASGVPVLCSRQGALQEIGQDAVHYFDDSVENMANAIELLVKEEKIRKEYIEKGLTRAKLFNWEECVKKTIYLINNLVNGG